MVSRQRPDVFIAKNTDFSFSNTTTGAVAHVLCVLSD